MLLLVMSNIGILLLAIWEATVLLINNLGSVPGVEASARKSGG